MDYRNEEFNNVYRHPRNVRELDLMIELEKKQQEIDAMKQAEEDKKQEKFDTIFLISFLLFAILLTGLVEGWPM